MAGSAISAVHTRVPTTHDQHSGRLALQVRQVEWFAQHAVGIGHALVKYNIWAADVEESTGAL